MKQSIRYLCVKVVVDHPDDVDPDDVVNEADYNFKSTSDNSTITDTEITEVSHTCFDFPVIE